LAPCGGDGTDALLATLGVTGSGKVGSSIHQEKQLADLCPQDAHNSRFTIPARSNTTRARRDFPIAWPKPREPRLHPYTRAVRRGIGSV
jgi:hypothetical protein